MVHWSECSAHLVLPGLPYPSHQLLVVRNDKVQPLRILLQRNYDRWRRASDEACTSPPFLHLGPLHFAQLIFAIPCHPLPHE